MIKRRTFLKTVTPTIPFFYIQQKSLGSNNRLQIAAIGVGGKGGSDLQQLARHGELVAACDVSEKKLNYSLKNYSSAAKFTDFREMITTMGEKIDVLSISAPDHIHAPAAKLALKYGIHLFIQAPLAHTFEETHQILEVVKQKKICTQVGMQGCASDSFRQGVEFLQSGSLGKILDIYLWTNRPLWPQAPTYQSRPSEVHNVPSDFDWNSFLGPAKERPYHPVYQPYRWRGWRDFGSGSLGDVGSHLFNLPVMGLNLRDLKKVTCLLVGPVNQETFPSWSIIKYQFGFRGTSELIPLFWYEGRVGHLSNEVLGKVNHPPRDLFLGKEISANGCLIRGSRGTFYAPSIYGTKWLVNDGKKWLQAKDLGLSDGKLPKNNRGDSGMKDELVRAIRTNTPQSPLANISYAAKVNQLTLLGNIVMLCGGEVLWDKKLGLTNRPEVNDLLRKSYRDGWKVAEI